MPLQTSERLRYRKLWDQLLSENAPLRVLDGDNLLSAPISYFDEVLMSLLADDWQKVSRIIGDALAFEIEDGILQTGDVFLSARLNAMARDGRLEIRGSSALDIRLSQGEIAGGACVTLSNPSLERRSRFHPPEKADVNRVLTSPYLWWFDLFFGRSHEAIGRPQKGWRFRHGNDRFIPRAAERRQSAERTLAVRAAGRAAGPISAR